MMPGSTCHNDSQQTLSLLSQYSSLVDTQLKHKPTPERKFLLEKTGVIKIGSPEACHSQTTISGQWFQPDGSACQLDDSDDRHQPVPLTDDGLHAGLQQSAASGCTVCRCSQRS